MENNISCNQNEEKKKGQHLVPRTHLKYFFDKDINNNEFYIILKDLSKIERTGTQDECFKKDYFYDIDGESEQFIENYLSNIEKSYTELINKIIEKTFFKKDKNKRLLSIYIFTQLIRTEKGQRDLNEYLSVIKDKDKLGKIIENDKKISPELKDVFNIFNENIPRDIYEKNIDKIIKDSSLNLIKQEWHNKNEGKITSLYKYIENQKFHFIINKTKIPFITSDHPVYRGIPKETIFIYNMFNKEEVIYFPISQEIALVTSKNTFYEEYTEFNESEKNNYFITELNKLTLSNSNKFIVSPNKNISFKLKRR